MLSNYPDDIRQYDSDPRSPFYNGPDCEETNEQRIEDQVEKFFADPILFLEGITEGGSTGKDDPSLKDAIYQNDAAEVGRMVIQRVNTYFKRLAEMEIE